MSDLLCMFLFYSSIGLKEQKGVETVELPNWVAEVAGDKQVLKVWHKLRTALPAPERVLPFITDHHELK